MANRYPAFLTRIQKSLVIRQLEQQPAEWMLVVGVVLGAGLGTMALFGVGGIPGIVLCLMVLGGAFLLSLGAEPVLREAASILDLLEMVELPGGTFLMGSPDSDGQVYDDEKPQHPVTVSAFAMSRYLVARRLYRQVMKWGGGVFLEWGWKIWIDDRLPAHYVTWFNAVKFCNALSKRQGLQSCYRIKGKQVTWDRGANGYRLPTEAEWEYAVRAGTTTRWFCGDEPDELERYAWFNTNAGGRVHAVGEKEPNPWGFYDLAGNVWEWCWDWYGGYKPEAVTDPVGPPTGDYRVLRGGAYWAVAGFLRSALRYGSEAEDLNVDFGFRCVRASRRQP